MAMWTSVSVFVEAESVEDINRVVNEIDLSDYYLPKWDVYGTDADSSSLDDIKEGSCDWEGLLALIAEKMGGRGKAWITEKCDEDYAYTTRYEYKDGEINTYSDSGDEENDDVDEDDPDYWDKIILEISFFDCSLNKEKFAEIRNKIIDFIQKNHYPVNISAEADIESVFSSLGLSDIVSVNEDNISLEGDIGCDAKNSALPYPILKLLDVLGPYFTSEMVGSVISKSGPFRIFCNDDGSLSYEW